MLSALLPFSLNPPCLPARAVTAPRFAGIQATRTAEDRWLSSSEMKRLLDQDSDPYLGRIPREIQQALGRDPTQTFQLMDRFSSYVQKRLQEAYGDQDRRFWGIERQSVQEIAARHPRLARYTYVASDRGRPVPVEFCLLGAGAYSMAYKMTVQGQHYVFKVFQDRESALYATSGQYKEAANGLFMTRKPTSNLVRFHAGNPEANWHLLEYVDEKTDPARRPGKTYEQHGFDFLDDKPANKVNGIRVDLGEMYRTDTLQISDIADDTLPTASLVEFLF